METNETATPDEASEALASAKRSRARLAWSGYPAWYWLITGASLGAYCYAMSLPTGWDVAAAIATALLLVIVARAAGRARGVCEGWVNTAMTMRDKAVLYGPAALVVITNAAVSKLAWWSSIVASVLVFTVFAGTGLLLGARAVRP